MNAISLAFRTLQAVSPAVAVHAVGRDDADTLLRLFDEQSDQAPAELPTGRHPRRAGLLEFHEALFDPPVRAWAWLARMDDEAVGFAFATVGFSLADRGYCLQLDALHVREPGPSSAVEAALFAQVAAQAQRLGCVQLQWTAPSWRAGVQRFDEHATRQDCVRYVLSVPASAG